MYRFIVVVLVSSWILAVGCGSLMEDASLPDVGGASGTVTWSEHNGTRPGIDQASVFHVGSMFVIWSSLPNGGGGDISSNMHGVACNGRFIGINGDVLKYACESEDGRTGSATIDGHTYDLSSGNLFLVANQGRLFRIQQLKRDLTRVPFRSENLRQWAAQDEQMRQFFAGEEASQVAPTDST